MQRELVLPALLALNPPDIPMYPFVTFLHVFRVYVAVER